LKPEGLQDSEKMEKWRNKLGTMPHEMSMVGNVERGGGIL